jgi:hypothetical protein
MVNYSQAKVYKIVDNTNGNLYVGSTCEITLARRLAEHFKKFNQYLNGKYRYVTSFQILQNKNYSIVLLEQCENITSRDELKSRERHYIETLNCVNKYIPLRTNKEWRIDNKEKLMEYYENNKDIISEKRKAHYETNKDVLLEKHRKWYDENRDKIKEKRNENKDKTKEYYETNKDILLEKKKEYYKANSDKLKAYQKQHRAEMKLKRLQVIEPQIE